MADVRLDRPELGAILTCAVESLPEPDRLVIVLCDIERLDTAETADVLDVSENTVRTRLVRGRARLRERLEELARRGSAEVFACGAERRHRLLENVMRAIASRPR